MWEGSEELAALGKAAEGRLRLRAGKIEVVVLRRGPRTLSVASADAGRLPGLVDLYDGERHVSHCLIVASGEMAGETMFDIKRESVVRSAAPLDFAGDEAAPI